MGKVLQLRRPEGGEVPKKATPVPMPDRFPPEQRRRLLELAGRDGFSLEEVVFAVRSVRDWWETRRRRRVHWHLVVLGAMRRGWALEGFKAHQQRQGPTHHNSRGEPVFPRTRITPEVVERLCREGDTSGDG